VDKLGVPMTIDAILFDADGVIQRTRGNWREQFAAMLGRDEDLETFVKELFAAERPCLSGAADFPTQLRTVLERWRSPTPVEQALQVWTNIEVHADVIELVGSLRRGGMPVHLASNQHAHRARYMSDELGYGAVFEREFYSCRVGYAKPDTAYFEHILGELKLPPERVLFIDDVEPNVVAARSVGISSVHFAANAGAAALDAHLAHHGVWRGRDGR
jgi:putative hydrolase of the HAD superfamily